MKRYLITFSDDSISLSGINDVFLSAGIKRAVTQAASQRQPDQSAKEDEIIFLDNIGIAIAYLSEIEMKELISNQAIASIEEDSEAHILGELVPDLHRVDHTANALWNMELVDADDAWRAGIFGDGVKAAIIDTGIAWHPNLRTHGGASFVSGNTSFRDDHGHGTHCAGIVGGKGINNVYGVAPGVHLYAVKVLDSSGTGYDSWILAGMDWCIANGMNVVSMSLGSTSPPRNAYATAIKKCHDNDVIVVCAAGNSNNTSFPWVCSPANSFVAGDSLASPIAVAAVDSGRVVASFSSRGGNNSNWNQVTVSAPGVSIFSTHLQAGYQTMSGTSQACPHVTGLVALILEKNQGLGAMAIKALITTAASNLGTAPYPNEAYGHGLIDCDGSVGP